MKREAIDVLVVEDDGVLGGAVAQRLRLEGMSVHWSQTVAEALRSLEKYEPALILCDIRLPDGSGTELYRRAGKLIWETDVIFATAYADIQEAIGLVKTGATDYLIKPYDINELVRRIKSSLARAVLPRGVRTPLRAFHYETAEMSRVVSQLKKLARENFSILLVGESGTGKEMAARLVHEGSGRAPSPFMPVSCADISEATLESKYFGSEPSMADSSKTPTLGLLEQVGSGKLRADLYYRLQSAQLTIPALRDRIADIIPLAEKLLEAHGASNPLAPFSLSDGAKRALVAHPWPGNVRELTNRVVQACTLAEQSLLQARDIFPETADQAMNEPSLSRTRIEAEKEEIERVIAECGGRVGEAAKKLGISRTTLWKRRRE